MAQARRLVAAATCASCQHFSQEPQEIEAQMPGIRSLGSAHASVCASDGICRRHDRYLAASSSCAEYRQRAQSSGRRVRWFQA
jgi:hypothetical protein